MLTSLLTGGHLMLETLPGLIQAKALVTLAAATGSEFRRIQFTSETLPTDLVSAEFSMDSRRERLALTRGPIFATFLQIDGLERASDRVLEYLAQILRERQVTLGLRTHRLPQPFMVLATREPREASAGTRLPETLADNFMYQMNLETSGPRLTSLNGTLGAAEQSTLPVSPVVDRKSILAARRVVERIHLDDRVADYAARLVYASRHAATSGLGLVSKAKRIAFPRAAGCLELAAKAQAFLARRGHVTPRDVQIAALDVLRHRIILRRSAGAQTPPAGVPVEQILEAVAMP
ncbi:MAG: MoxR family ATPase [Deltaproteobacteria bacterium]|nr:MoxR family ATPase [Deltaproteobacteria bacterium]